jgi:predicted transcriptional regulator YdeE
MTWRTHSVPDEFFISVAESHWVMVVTRQAARAWLTTRGPETKATTAAIPQNADFFGVQFSLRTFLPGFELRQPTTNGLERDWRSTGGPRFGVEEIRRTKAFTFPIARGSLIRRRKRIPDPWKEPPVSEQYSTVALPDPQIEHRPAVTIAGIRKRHQMEGFDFAEFPRQIAEMTDLLPTLDGRIGDRVYDVFWGMFHDLGGVFEYLVGVEVGDERDLPDGFVTLEIPAGPYATASARPGVDPRDTVFTLWNEWLPASEATHRDNEAEFIYARDEDYDETQRNGTVDIRIPVTT